MILVGDIGGTKSLLEVGIVRDGKWIPRISLRYQAVDFPDFPGVLRQFIADWRQRSGDDAKLTDACLGVAGPCAGNRVDMTNLPWTVDGGEISAEFNIARVEVVNDFAAAAAGIDMLEPKDLLVLQGGAAAAGAPQLVVGAGTGLGTAYRLWLGGRYQAIPCEAGHCGFAPTTALQLDLTRHLLASQGRVSVEDVVSGPGLKRVYDYLAATGSPPLPVAASPAEIVERAGNDALCARALDLFVECYGEFAGSMALAMLARGGVYIAGGIAPRILPRLRAGKFMESFNSKGTHSGVARDIPLHIVVNDHLGLLGCAAIAAHFAGD